MKNSEIDILVLESLDIDLPKTTSEITSIVRSRLGPKACSEAEIFQCLTNAEKKGFISRTKTEKFNSDKPVSSISWILIHPYKRDSNPNTSAPYIQDATIVVSQPIFLSVQGVDLSSLGLPIINVRDAMDRVVSNAKNELRIACPYYDELFIDILSKYAKNISTLDFVGVIAESVDAILIKAQTLLKNIKIKTIFKQISTGTKYPSKVQGVHAKLMIADKSEVLIGSFNFRFSHINYNIDLGILARGRIAEDYAKIYDHIWGSRQ